MSESRKEPAAGKLERLLLEGLKSGSETCIDRAFWREIKMEAAQEQSRATRKMTHAKSAFN
jgi:hypothetical protein